MFRAFTRFMTYNELLGARAALLAISSKLLGRPELVEVTREGIRYPFYLRLRSSDIATFRQVFARSGYDLDMRKVPATIIDAGANIGLTSIYFANRFPEAKILAIEPEQSNFDLLRRNVSPYPNIVPIQAALWSELADLDVVDSGIGNWAFRTQQSGDDAPLQVMHRVRGVTIDGLMSEHGIDCVDILKMDIEGAEKEVFESMPAWIGKTRVLITELHERFKPGCNRAFYNATNGFELEWSRGDNVFLARKGYAGPRGPQAPSHAGQ